VKILQSRSSQILFLTTYWILIAFILLLRAFSVGLSHDEYQFVASGQIFARYFLLPYRDYPFLHMPYLPFVNGVLFLFTGGALLSARLINEIFFLASALLLFVLIQRNFGKSLSWAGIGAGSIAVGLMVFDPSFIDMDGRALNHALPTFLGLLAFSFYLQTGSSPHALRWIAASGVAVGLATGARLSFAVMAIPLLAALVLFPSEDLFKNRLIKGVVFSLGFLGGLLPAAFLFFLAPQQAYYGNLLYIRLNTIYRQQLDFTNAMSLRQKLGFFITTILETPNGFVEYLLFFSVLGAAALRLVRKRQPARLDLLVSASLAVALLAAGFAPTPVWPQYFFAPIPFLLLVLFYGLQGWGSTLGWLGMAILVAVLLLGSAAPLGTLWQAIHHPQDWTTAKAALQANALRAVVPSGQVLTLAPIVPLEAGLGAYPVFTNGPFSWRTAPILAPEKRTLYGVIGPDELEDYLAKDPPAAILTGPEQNYEGFTADDTLGLESPFTQYAQFHGYRPQIFPCKLYTQCTLWLK